jgi:hypothetical protein
MEGIIVMKRRSAAKSIIRSDDEAVAASTE